MGISGLLPLLKSIHRPTELKKYAGETLGVDGYGWLHRGAVACAIELAQGKPTRKYVDFAMHRVRMFKYFGVTPYVVFDGDFLPSKAKTEASREKRREESRKIGLEFLRAGKPSQAYSELQKAIDVTPEMARHLIEELKKAEVPYLVAPYEADAQLVYLERQSLITGIVSEDSDLLVFGAKRLLTKLDQHGQCVEINRRDFCAVREISLTGWTDNEFRHMAILSGCDFLHQRVFCPRKKEIVLLTEPEPSANLNDMPFIGAPIETELARAIAAGDVNPITKQPILVPISPGKRRISQTLAPASLPEKRLGKPISEYFAARRVPLGEMDPNCFAVEPSRNNGSTETAPRPIVFPLPRPYLDGAEPPSAPSRPYTNSTRTIRRQSEPISSLLGLSHSASSENRRRTTGPVIQVYQDATRSARPPKKARLCDDPVVEDAVGETPERSRFFSSTKQAKPAKKEVDLILMSDDSIEEAFRSLPDFDSRRPQKSAPAADDFSVLEEPCPEKLKEEAVLLFDSRQDDDGAKDVVEVPASSPVQAERAEKNGQQDSTSVTPLGRLLKEFSYETAEPRTRVIHGLHTPASSTKQTAAPKNAAQSTPRTPLLTPLQRIGAQAFQRGKCRSSLPTPRTPAPNKCLDLLSPVNPALVPLPKADIGEVEALNMPLGSEDQIVPESDEEDETGGEERGALRCDRRLDLSKFLYT